MKSVRPLGMTLSVFEIAVLVVSCLPFLSSLSYIVKLIGSLYLSDKVSSDYNPKKL